MTWSQQQSSLSSKSQLGTISRASRQSKKASQLQQRCANYGRPRNRVTLEGAAGIMATTTKHEGGGEDQPL